MKHTGYSMHWNLTTPSSTTLNSYNSSFYQDIAIPFQLFGLTPLSCGFNVKLKSGGDRFEIAGDSLTNIDQINATALLLGAYNLAKTNNNFLIEISEIKNNILYLDRQTNHMLRNGRYTILNLEKNIMRKHDSTIQTISEQETCAQNILELFYDWISPFVYKLGERDEINNLEAFVTGEKNLEMDDIKYFHMLNKKSKEFIAKYKGNNSSGVYQPVYISTIDSKRSQILKLVKQNDKRIPIEGELWQKSITKNLDIKRSINWDRLEIGNKYGYDYEIAYDMDDAYNLLSQISKVKYVNSLDYSDIHPKTIFAEEYLQIINKKSIYNPSKDNSAIIEDPIMFEKYLHNKKYLNEIEVR
jgi:hypothetical protein